MCTYYSLKHTLKFNSGTQQIMYADRMCVTIQIEDCWCYCIGQPHEPSPLWVQCGRAHIFRASCLLKPRDNFTFSYIYLLHSATTSISCSLQEHAIKRTAKTEGEQPMLAPWHLPSKACRLALHCVNLSSGSLCGKNTELGIPLAAGSKRKPTDISRSFQPLTWPTLFSMLCCVVYIAFFWPRWILCSDFSTCVHNCCSEDWLI